MIFRLSIVILYANLKISLCLYIIKSYTKVSLTLVNFKYSFPNKNASLADISGLVPIFN